MKTIADEIKSYSELVKLPHTLFALPFALSSVCIAQAETGGLTLVKLFLIIAAFTCARSVAMGFNRIADRVIDAKNPRTANRPICSGKISVRAASVFVAISAILFVAIAYLINTMCFALSFPALIVLFGYSYCKRFTALSHYVLGIALACAPAGAWIAVADNFDPRILALSAGLMFNIAAFDIFYAVQDMDFDRQNNLFSVPSRFGMKGVFLISGASMVAAFACFCATVFLFNGSTIFWTCVLMIGAIYISAETVFFKSGLKRIDIVFFWMNITISLLILLGGISLLF